MLQLQARVCFNSDYFLKTKTQDLRKIWDNLFFSDLTIKEIKTFPRCVVAQHFNFDLISHSQKMKLLDGS